MRVKNLTTRRCGINSDGSISSGSNGVRLRGPLERYITLAPEATRGYEALGFLHFQRQNYPQAMEMYQAVIQRKPNVATYRNSLAGVYVMLERYPEAIEHYQTAIRLKPSEPRFYLNLSKAYRLAGDTAEAEKAEKEYERLLSQSK